MFKKVKGRKRHILVDTEGLVLGASVSPANASDRQESVGLFERALKENPTIRKVWADKAHEGGAVEEWLEKRFSVGLEVAARTPGAKGFEVLPRRWVVERTFGWMGRNRRMSKDYEFLPQTSEALVYVTMIRLMLKRLARKRRRASS